MNKFFDDRKKVIERGLLFILLTAFTIVYSIIAVQSHNHFETFGWDLGFFDQIIWKASTGDLVAYSTLAKENLLADHFQVVLYFLAPLYWIKNDVRMILIAQAFLVVIAGYPLYYLSKLVSKNIIFSFSAVLSYLLFLGTQWLILNEFHQTFLLPIFLILIFYSLHEKKKWIYWFGITGLIITKEEFGLLAAALGLLVLIKYPWKIIGIVTIILGISSFFILIYMLMPFLSINGVYSHFDFGIAGYTPIDVIKKSLTDPLFFIKSMTEPSVKIKTVFDSFLAFGFLPLISPLYLLPVVENFVTRFIYAGPQFTKWVNINQHASPLGILLTIASLQSGVFIIKRFQVRNKHIWSLLGMYLTVMSLGQNIYLHGPVNSIFKKQLFETQTWMKDNNEIINQVPSNVSVAAQNSILPHLSQRREIYLLPEINQAEYIVADLHDGPNKYSPLTKKETENLLSELVVSGKYTIVNQKGETILFKKTDNFAYPSF